MYSSVSMAGGCSVSLKDVFHLGGGEVSDSAGQ